uniref:Uncharacterized protein n=1 Tax=Chlamydomonas euryale TaxID=1486919 RepID=A0A7R9YZ41_9CHLO|mmetsp:Transcript_34312/g.101955  ORF Transcript_34312/g.101955 Transcript_34312/m.101955 type:complete len:151 (+) Transcript_34312:129-581(+)
MARGKADARIEQRISTLKENAKSHLTKSEYSEALSCLDLAIDLNMSSFKLYRLRAITHACLGNYRGVAEDANKVIELAPTIMDGYYHKGYALFNLKEYSDAAKAFQQGLRLHPNDKVLRQGFWDSIALVSQSRSRNQDDAPVTEGELLIA